ncbi:phage tail protein [Erwinia psidii]|uniref:Phage tail protein n=1 Tax=Erwinia psidii TaxID=69224 RepID=A0A3N6UMU5_9GAMM|nr:phage tail protein [Erwinia psidii]RQM37249.1 phage tail protein [Erwinia psidii]
MATKYFALLTSVGAAKLANAAALGEQLEITSMAVGDGAGELPMPDAAQTTLVNELRRGPLNTLSVDPDNTNQIIAEQVIPDSAGGWWIREIGLYDSSGDLIAIANCAETYKPQLQEGSGRVQVIRMILIVSSTDAITLKIDPSVVLATRQYTDNALTTALNNLNLNDAARMGVATAAQMAEGTATDLLPSVAAVMGLFSKGPFTANDYVRIPDVPGGLIIQFATVRSGASGACAWTHPIPFPGARLAAWGICHRTNVSGTDSPTISFDDISDVTPKTVTNFNLRVNGAAGAYSACVMALGY